MAKYNDFDWVSNKEKICKEYGIDYKEELRKLREDIRNNPVDYNHVILPSGVDLRREGNKLIMSSIKDSKPEVSIGEFDIPSDYCGKYERKTLGSESLTNKTYGDFSEVKIADYAEMNGKKYPVKLNNKFDFSNVPSIEEVAATMKASVDKVMATWPKDNTTWKSKSSGYKFFVRRCERGIVYGYYTSDSPTYVAGECSFYVDDFNSKFESHNLTKELEELMKEPIMKPINVFADRDKDMRIAHHKINIGDIIEHKDYPDSTWRINNIDDAGLFIYPRNYKGRKYQEKHISWNNYEVNCKKVEMNQKSAVPGEVWKTDLGVNYLIMSHDPYTDSYECCDIKNGRINSSITTKIDSSCLYEYFRKTYDSLEEFNRVVFENNKIPRGSVWISKIVGSTIPWVAVDLDSRTGRLGVHSTLGSEKTMSWHDCNRWVEAYKKVANSVEEYNKMSNQGRCWTCEYRKSVPCELCWKDAAKASNEFANTVKANPHSVSADQLIDAMGFNEEYRKANENFKAVEKMAYMDKKKDFPGNPIDLFADYVKGKESRSFGVKSAAARGIQHTITATFLFKDGREVSIPEPTEKGWVKTLTTEYDPWNYSYMDMNLKFGDGKLNSVNHAEGLCYMKDMDIVFKHEHVRMLSCTWWERDSVANMKEVKEKETWQYLKTFPLMNGVK